MKGGLRLLRLALLCLLGLTAELGAARDLRVLVVLSDDYPVYQAFAQGLKQHLPANIQAIVLERAEGFAGQDQSVDLVISVGMKAADLAAGTAKPLLATMVPRHKYADWLAQRPPAVQTTAIFIDHSWASQAALLRAALPEAKRIGVLYSSDKHLDLDDLRKQLAMHGAVLIARQNTAPASLFDDLEYVLTRSDAMLAVPDSVIYNNNSIRNILLTSYRQNVPLVGFSLPYVNAGALCALFSTPEQIAEQAAAITAGYALKSHLPEPQFPEKYRIAVNQEVARALGSPIRSDELVRLQYEKLRRMAQ